MEKKSGKWSQKFFIVVLFSHFHFFITFISLSSYFLSNAFNFLFIIIVYKIYSKFILQEIIYMECFPFNNLLCSSSIFDSDHIYQTLLWMSLCFDINLKKMINSTQWKLIFEFMEIWATKRWTAYGRIRFDLFSIYAMLTLSWHWSVRTWRLQANLSNISLPWDLHNEIYTMIIVLVNCC